MSSTYSGYKIAISAGTNAIPCAITTSTPHGRTTGDLVLLSGTGFVDGEWTVTVTGASTFTINNTTFPGGSFATGFVYFFPPSYTIPGDGDAPTAASVNVAFQAAGDRTLYSQAKSAVEATQRAAILQQGETGPALNFPAAAVSVGASCFGLAFSAADQAWYAAAGAASASVFRSLDNGKTWASKALTGSITAFNIAADNAGNICMIQAGNVQAGAWSAFDTLTWSQNAAACFNSLTDGCIVYEPVNARWFGIGAISGGNVKAGNSSNRTTWVASTIPTTWSTATTGTYHPLGVGNGLIVAAFIDSASTFRTMRSADGGVTWTNDQQITPAFSGGVTTAPIWSATDQLWYIAYSTTSGTRKTQVYSSPDAITWTSVVSLTANDVRFVSGAGLACVGSLLMGVSDDGRIFTSVNKGANWFRAGSCGVAAPANAISSGLGFIVLGTTTAVTSQRFGLPSQAA